MTLPVPSGSVPPQLISAPTQKTPDPTINPTMNNEAKKAAVTKPLPPIPAKSKSQEIVPVLRVTVTQAPNALISKAIVNSVEHSVEHAVSERMDIPLDIPGTKKTNEKLEKMEAVMAGIIKGATQIGNEVRIAAKTTALMLNSEAAVNEINTRALDKLAPKVDPEAVLKEVFPNTRPEHREVIKGRLDAYAKTNGIDNNTMYAKILEGKKIAGEIVANDGSHWFKNPPSAKDMVNLDWYLTAQEAKQDALYLKGTRKLPDPDQKLLAFCVNVKGLYHGSEVDTYGRDSSHWLEKQDAIANKVIKYPEGQYVCFSKGIMDALLAKGVKRENIHNFDHQTLGIDVSSATQLGSLDVAGKNTSTFLIKLVPEKDQASGQDVTMLAMKRESHSAAPISNTSHGSLLDRIRDSALHGLSWLKKKGLPESMRSEPNLETAFHDRKEDKLSPTIKEALKNVNLDHPELQQSYRELRETTGAGSDYSLDKLDAHLKLLLTKVSPDSAEMKAIIAIRKEISSIYARYEADSAGLSYNVRPRSNEVGLGTLEDCLANHTRFHA